MSCFYSFPSPHSTPLWFGFLWRLIQVRSACLFSQSSVTEVCMQGHDPWFRRKGARNRMGWQVRKYGKCDRNYSGPFSTEMSSLSLSLHVEVQAWYRRSVRISCVNVRCALTRCIVSWYSELMINLCTDCQLKTHRIKHVFWNIFYITPQIFFAIIKAKFALEQAMKAQRGLKV